ncbi:uncharacterized [Tachysurus ichikawai]
MWVGAAAQIRSGSVAESRTAMLPPCCCIVEETERRALNLQPGSIWLILGTRFILRVQNLQPHEQKISLAPGSRRNDVASLLFWTRLEPCPYDRCLGLRQK